MTLETHCGVYYLGRLNDQDWVASDPGSASTTDWMPQGWPAWGETEEPLRARLLLAPDGSTIEASFNDVSVTYLPADGVPEHVRLCE